MSYVVRSSRRS